MEYVLITGGSSGIGYELSRCFAADGFGIILAASDCRKLELAKQKLEQEFGIEVRVYEEDLAGIGAAKRLYERIKGDGIRISVLVNNAGFGVIGAAEEADLEKEECMMILNMITPVELTKLFLKDMYREGKGRILNVSSTGAFQPGPYTASYYASKAFLLSYSRAVRYEAKKKGVSICTVCPGTTNTGFFSRAGAKTPRGAMSAERVAACAYQGLQRKKEVTVPGISFRLMRLCPVKLKMTVLAWVKKPKK